jgi:hypothetical protein
MRWIVDGWRSKEGFSKTMPSGQVRTQLLVTTKGKSRCGEILFEIALADA